MNIKQQKGNYDIVFQKLNYLRLENADITILCDNLTDCINSSFEIIDNMKALAEVNKVDNVQCYSGS